jgi:hypothetical protein
LAQALQGARALETSYQFRRPRSTRRPAEPSQRRPRVAAEAQFVDAVVFRRYYAEFALGYRTGLLAAQASGEIAKGNAEVLAWALMGVSDMVGWRFALCDAKAPVRRVVEAAYALIAQGLARPSDPRKAPGGGRKAP